VLSAELARRVESGMTLVIGTVGAGGRPFASRGWGIRVVDPEGGLLRVLLRADDSTTMANLAGGGRLAITSGDVRTFFTVQMKGHAVALEEPTVDDLDAAEVWADGFLSLVAGGDGYSRAQLEKWRPSDVVAVVAQVSELFDQTPGPTAGTTYGADAR
jgi:hypothetical protein